MGVVLGRIRWPRLTICAVAALLVSCTDQPTAVEEPTLLSLAVVSGDAQSAPPGAELSEPLVVAVSKEGKKPGEFSPAEGVLVNFRVVKGDGSVFAGAALTNKDGIARDFWTLGPKPGTNRVEVRAVDTETGEKRVYGQFTAEALPLFAYVAGAAGGVAVVDVAKNTVVETVPVENGRGIAITPDRSRAYVATGPRVSVIDLASNTVLPAISVGRGAIDLVITPDGKSAYVIGFAHVSVIDLATNGVVAEVATFQELSGIAISPDGATVYATNWFNGGTHVIDVATNVATGFLRSVGSSTYGAAVTPDDKYVYVSDAGPTISVFDRAGLVVDVLNFGSGNSRQIAITPDGSFAYINNNFSEVQAFDLATGTVRATVPGIQLTNEFVNNMAFTPDGAALYVTSRAGTVAVIDVATHTLSTTVTVGGQPQGVAITAR